MQIEDLVRLSLPDLTTGDEGARGIRALFGAYGVYYISLVVTRSTKAKTQA